VTAVVGGQYGSEGKGLVVGALARLFDTHVRSGAANAGHTLHAYGEAHVLRQLPCAAYANPQAACALGPGALISPKVLVDEVRANRAWRSARGLPDLALVIDPRAHVVTPEHVEREAASDLAERIGSTSARGREGIGEAQAARVRRDTSTLSAGECADAFEHCDISDVPQWLSRREGHCPRGESPLPASSVLLEGTQGAGLSNTTGCYPYVTSRDATAATLAVDAGLGPGSISDVLLVCRTFPIRVAGHSGPFHPDSRELSWSEVGVAPERTTVTRLERRVATFSGAQVQEAARLNSATGVALTFCDYLDPSLARRGSPLDPSSCSIDPERLRVAHPRVAALVDEVEGLCGVPVKYLGCGPSALIAYESPLIPPLIAREHERHLRWAVAHRAHDEEGWRFEGRDEMPRLCASGYPMAGGRLTTAPSCHYFHFDAMGRPHEESASEHAKRLSLAGTL
jgi:adenylosuccinate synthase